MTPSAFIPSSYQQTFFNALLAPGGDIQLTAVAGSGKSTSIEEGVQRLPSDMWSRTLCTAFNSHIKKELEGRQKQGRIPYGVTIMTIHGLGYGVLRKAFSPRNAGSWVDERKYEKLVRMAWDDLDITAELTHGDNVDAYHDARDCTSKLTRLAMLTLTDANNPDALLELAAHYGVDLPLPVYVENMLGVIPRILRWGKEGAPFTGDDGARFHPSRCISFDDMVYLPIALNLPVPQFDLCLVDECQDFNRAQQELLLRAKGQDGRAIWVGDPRQSIYGFTGADPESFHRIAAITGAQQLPLSICYRCGKKIVALAQRLVPAIEAAPKAKDGAVITTSSDALFELAANRYKIDPGNEPFLLLCRINAPLVRGAYEFIRRGVPAFVKGREIGTGLVKIVDDIEAIEGFEPTRFDEFMAVYQSVKRASFERQKNPDAALAALDDRLDCIRAVRDYLNGQGRIADVGAVRAQLLSLFADNSRGVVLSSIHKAKGLEARAVGILMPQLLPHPMAKLDWELQQEKNLMYVAITRASEELYIAGEIGFFKGQDISA